ncbi:cardiolipin synthetase [Xinfangfangia sp. D13-10-4-6]|uniref:phospholipase D-like domain-containing protein n=1 Tax=Pseudogemmobacter hezensis TaxID=2737662 RepID=UPI00155713D6|nr:phospholipase D-like domain-containing protein [Pseudogemmobacter hezensis]NPD16432.1 cardiolipin synthetase [Pseudogemmobacter hezensis]
MYLLFEHLLIVLGVLAVASAMILALQARRTPQSSAAWILFIIMVPYIAVPVFLVLGFRKSGRSFPAIRFSPHPSVPSVEAPHLARVFASLGAPEAVSGNQITLHESPQAANEALQAVITSARERLDILLYVLANDDSGLRFLAQLTARVQAGVKVRLSVDWLGSLGRPRKALREFVQAGGELRYFSPIDHFTDTAHLNLRNHRKLVIADCRRVWSGGRNVGDDYLASPPGQWVDLSFSAEGPVLDAFNAVFASDWEVAGEPLDAPFPPPSPPAGQAQLQLVPAGPDEPQDVLHDGLVAAIYRARQRIWIATPYFVPTEGLAQALATAARTGVDVRIFLPAKSNQWTTDLARGPYMRALAPTGVRFLRFRPGMMHAKAGLIDDAAWIGSANFDVRSMLLNFELTVFAWDQPTVTAVTRWFERLLPDCEEGVAEAKLPRRLIEGVFRLGAPIL